MDFRYDILPAHKQYIQSIGKQVSKSHAGKERKTKHTQQRAASVIATKTTTKKKRIKVMHRSTEYDSSNLWQAKFHSFIIVILTKY